ncbi:MAG: hypothetical protein GY696_07040 [Gammaproteobacteria bacterium]|nr:hypothetical protein [Gammaproteobacteria bacterium]
MKIVEIVSFVTENNVQAELYHKGDIHVIANQLLDERRAEQLTRKYKECADRYGIIDTEKCFRHLECYLDDEIELVTFELSIRTTEPSHNNNDTAGSSKPQAPADKKGQIVLVTDMATEGKGEYAYSIESNPLDEKHKQKTTDKPPTPKLEQTGPGTTPKPIQCNNCHEEHTHLYYCKQFQSSEVKERIKIATASNCCFRCLRMDSQVDLSDLNGWWETHKNDCRTDHYCNVGGCSRVTHRRQKHILCCVYHTKINSKRLGHFKQTMDSDKIPSVELLFVGDYIQTAHSLPEQEFVSPNTLPDVTSPSIFMCQEIPSPNGGHPLLIFYDSGCGSCCISTRAATALDSKTLREGPTILNVAGGRSVEIPYGVEQFVLDLADYDACATLSGIQMDNPTAPFPTWKLQEAYGEITRAGASTGAILPTVPDKVGGTSVDIIVGIKYNTLFPKLIMQLPCGLALYESKFAGIGGHRGILGGPHKAWAEVHATTSFMSTANYFMNEMKAAQYQWKSLLDTPDWSVATVDAASDANELQTSKVHQSSTKHVMKQLRGSEKNLQEVLKSHAKLVDNENSCRVDKLPIDVQRQLIDTNPESTSDETVTPSGDNLAESTAPTAEPCLNIQPIDQNIIQNLPDSIPKLSIEALDTTFYFILCVISCIAAVAGLLIINHRLGQQQFGHRIADTMVVICLTCAPILIISTFLLHRAPLDNYLGMILKQMVGYDIDNISYQTVLLLMIVTFMYHFDVINKMIN